METVENPFAEPPLTPEVSPQKPAHGYAPGSVANRITPETARIMQAKWKAKREAMREALKNPVPVVREVSPEASVEKLKSRVERIDERIEAIIDKMEESTCAKDTQALAMALDRLCGVWSLLTGHPRPGVRKDASKGRRMGFANPSD